MMKWNSVKDGLPPEPRGHYLVAYRFENKWGIRWQYDMAFVMGEEWHDSKECIQIDNVQYWLEPECPDGEESSFGS